MSRKYKIELITIGIPKVTHSRLRAVAGAKRLSVRDGARTAIDEWTEREAKVAARELHKIGSEQ